jgi:hypothetical protein
VPVSKDEFYDSSCVLKEHRKLKNVFFSVIEIECSRDEAVANFDKKKVGTNRSTPSVYLRNISGLNGHAARPTCFMKDWAADSQRCHCEGMLV